MRRAGALGTLLAVMLGLGAAQAAARRTPAAWRVPAPLSRYLDRCWPGPHCDLEWDRVEWPSYGNTRANIGDCLFAAAADYEAIRTHLVPEEATIAYEFGAAGGSAATGLSVNRFWRWWEEPGGIAGWRATHLYWYDLARPEVEAAVHEQHAMYVLFRLYGWFGQYDFSTPAMHAAIIDGYTPEGPLVATWGETVQMTWQQWSAEATKMYSVGLAET